MATLQHSLLYYRLKGFSEIEVPWTVEPAVSAITKPRERRDFFVGDRCLVGSAEQSFIQLLQDGRLSSGRYVACTPCFRDEPEDETHRTYFMKTELMIVLPAASDIPPTSADGSGDLAHELALTALSFFSLYLPTSCLQVTTTETGYDVLAGSLELGSYGYGCHGLHRWVYGTGCAEPRLTTAIRTHMPRGYHLEVIPKYPIGTSGKVIEEFEEWKDALLQGNRIMELVELSDLYGALQLYLRNAHGLSMDDLRIMNDATQRAFRSGRRQ